MARPFYILSLNTGNLIETTGTGLAIAGLFLANGVREPTSNLIVLVALWVCLWYFPHCLVHFIVGRIGGIAFTHYVVGKSALVKFRLPYLTKLLSYLPVLGIRTERSSLSRSTPKVRKLMFQSGAYASMLLPNLTVLDSLIYSAPTTSALLILMSVVNVAVTLYYSPRAGDMWRSGISYP